MARPLTDAELTATRVSLFLNRDYKPEVVDNLLATVEARDDRIDGLKTLVAALRPHCRYLDRREAEHYKTWIRSELGEPAEVTTHG